METPPIVTITDQYVVQCVFDRVQHDKCILEEKIRAASKEFLSKYPQFTIEATNIFDVYCDIKCVVSLKLR